MLAHAEGDPMGCGHLICELAKGGCHVVAGSDFGMGGPIGASSVPPATIEQVRQLIAGLDRDAVRAELARRKLEQDLEALVGILKSEKQECRRTQSTSGIRDRSAQLLDKLAAIRTVEDLATALD